mmetsp:Transcript_36910/g.109606  ORF Transcript_36910/g.109606 Transcript_36910/m.109606 type:complete len:233 (-) Transcript_36910:35-733(-)
MVRRHRRLFSPCKALAIGRGGLRLGGPAPHPRVLRRLLDHVLRTPHGLGLGLATLTSSALGRLGSLAELRGTHFHRRPGSREGGRIRCCRGRGDRTFGHRGHRAAALAGRCRRPRGLPHCGRAERGAGARRKQADEEKERMNAEEAAAKLPEAQVPEAGKKRRREDITEEELEARKKKWKKERFMQKKEAERAERDEDDRRMRTSARRFKKAAKPGKVTEAPKAAAKKKKKR